MEQKLNVNLEILVPNDMVLVKKSEFEQLESQDDYGKWVKMPEFVSRASRSDVWLKSHVLNNPMLIETLKVENGGWVYYPNSKGDHWAFRLTGMKEFLENDFHRFIGGVK